MSKIHELKILSQYFNAVLDGTKTFELRKNDRRFEVGDTLVLKEYLQEISDRYKTTLHAQYTGQEVKKEISYILDGGKYGLQEGYVILALGEYKEMRNITDEEIEAFGKFSDYEKVIIKEQYSKYPKGFFPNPMCALY